jgi:VWFA-related protein
MPTRPTRLAVLALVLPLLTDAVRLKAAEQAFSEQVEVNVVNLEIFATTGSGQPVTDLKREDFSVLEDGRPVSLTNFFVSDREPRTGPGAPLPAPPTATAPARPPGPPSPPRPEDQRLHLVVLVDDVNTVPEHRNRMLAQLGDFFDRTLEPGDVVMLVRYDGTPQVVRPFTDDRGQLQGDLAKLATLAGDLAKRQSSYQTAVE